MILTDTLFLATPSYRSRAYAQAMSAAGLLPARVIALPGNEPIWEGAAEITVALRPGRTARFRPGETVAETFACLGVPVVGAVSADVNSVEFIDQLRTYPEPVLIFSGPGGVIVRAPALGIGKRFLHVHGGYAPQFRGSTAFYYSILDEGTIGATALWLTEVLDGGPILDRRRYEPVPGIEIDRIQDPLARADLLVDVLEGRQREGRYPDGAPDGVDAHTYYVIHPVLKHVALDRTGLLQH
ncbi:MAG: hypothetical protein RIR00_1635 [Pseudomonadota bacterium]|jgi:methionyl-tRNA formyltransferase